MKTVALIGWDRIDNYKRLKPQIEALGVKVVQHTYDRGCHVIARVQFYPDSPTVQNQLAEAGDTPVVELGHHFGGNVIGTENLERVLQELKP